MSDEGKLIASGRDADIFAYGSDRVLRRSRNGRSMVTEARTMAFVRAQGYPAPEVFDVSDDGAEMVMERVDGPTMVDAAARQPWRLSALGSELADLHRRLHDLPVPEWLPNAPVGSGSSLLHLDLHPLNVLMSAQGPVVIDWTNAARGNPLTDVALTWALIASGEVPGGRTKALLLGLGRRVLLHSFLRGFRGPSLDTVLAESIEWKCADRNLSEREIQRMRTLR